MSGYRRHWPGRLLPSTGLQVDSDMTREGSQGISSSNNNIRLCSPLHAGITHKGAVYVLGCLMKMQDSQGQLLWSHSKTQVTQPTHKAPQHYRLATAHCCSSEPDSKSLVLQIPHTLPVGIKIELSSKSLLCWLPFTVSDVATQTAGVTVAATVLPSYGLADCNTSLPGKGRTTCILLRSVA